MSLAEKILPHYTYEEYVQWEGKWELMEGFPIAMSPAPSLKHQWVASNLNYAIVAALKKANCKKCRAYHPIDYKISEDTVLQPDLVIVCGDTKKKFLDFAPALVVEILSPVTALRDRHTKFKIYEQQGIRYFLLVNIDNESVEKYRLVNASYELIIYDEKAPFTFHLEDD